MNVRQMDKKYNRMGMEFESRGGKNQKGGRKHGGLMK